MDMGFSCRKNAFFQAHKIDAHFRPQNCGQKFYGHKDFSDVSRQSFGGPTKNLWDKSLAAPNFCFYSLSQPTLTKLWDGRTTVSESTASNTELSEFFCPHRAPGRELSELLSAYYLCANANSPSSSQNSPSSPQNSVSVRSIFQNSTLETAFRPFPINTSEASFQSQNLMKEKSASSKPNRICTALFK